MDGGQFVTIFQADSLGSSDISVFCGTYYTAAKPALEAVLSTAQCYKLPVISSHQLFLFYHNIMKYTAAIILQPLSETNYICYLS